MQRGNGSVTSGAWPNTISSKWSQNPMYDVGALVWGKGESVNSAAVRVDRHLNRYLGESPLIFAGPAGLLLEV